MKILLADDNRDAVETLAAILSLENHHVMTARDGLTALATAQAAQPDAILLDINMPGMDGYTLCEHLRREPWGRAALIIALSGYGSPQNVDRSRLAGFDRHFTKPADPREILDYLAEH